MKWHKKKRGFYCPIWRAPDGSEFCFEAMNAPTEELCRKQTSFIQAQMERNSPFRYSGNVHRVEEDRTYHLVKLGDHPDSTAIVLSGPVLDAILGLDFHPDVDDGVEQPLGYAYSMKEKGGRNEVE